MTYYTTCPICGSHLDPGEKCSCCSEEEKQNRSQTKEKDARSDTAYWMLSDTGGYCCSSCRSDAGWCHPAAEMQSLSTYCPACGRYMTNGGLFIEAGPEPKGYWIRKKRGVHQVFCSKCGGKESTPRPYCPRCGTRMNYGQPETQWTVITRKEYL